MVLELPGHLALSRWKGPCASIIGTCVLRALSHQWVSQGRRYQQHLSPAEAPAREELPAAQSSWVALGLGLNSASSKRSDSFLR